MGRCPRNPQASPGGSHRRQPGREAPTGPQTLQRPYKSLQHHHTQPVHRGAMQCVRVMTTRPWPLEASPPARTCCLSTRCSPFPIANRPARVASPRWVRGTLFHPSQPHPERCSPLVFTQGAGTGRGTGAGRARAAHRWSTPRLHPGHGCSDSSSSPGSCSWPARLLSLYTAPHPASRAPSLWAEKEARGCTGGTGPSEGSRSRNRGVC